MSQRILRTIKMLPHALSFGASLPHFPVFFFQRITIIFLPVIASRCLQHNPVFFPTHRITETP
jgi:hypothetical protein